MEEKELILDAMKKAGEPLAGAAIYGSEAGTWIDFLTLVINQKLTGADLRNMIFAFPTQTYMIVNILCALLIPVD